MGADQHDVVIVGAGLAGLNAARILHRFGVDVVVLEGAGAVGGRVRTDLVDGFRLDHGFQLYNPAYPAGLRTFDAAALALKPFAAGVAVHRGGRLRTLADPRRDPSALPATLVGALAGTVAPPWELASFAAYAAACGTEPMARLRARPDLPILDALHGRGVGRRAVERVIGPFLSGVLADEGLQTSRRYADLVLRSFVRGTPAVPAAGMQQLPEQIAADLPPGALRLGAPVSAIRGTTVETPAGEAAGRVLIVATQAPAATELLPGLRVPAMSSLTTWYFAHESGAHNGGPHLIVDGEGAPWLCNLAVMNRAAPGYAPPGTDLIAATAVGHHPDGQSAQQAKAQAARLIGTSPGKLREMGRYPVREALPVFAPGTPLRRRIAARDGVLVIGDHRDTPSIQGALVSGERGAEAAVRLLGFR